MSKALTLTKTQQLRLQTALHEAILWNEAKGYQHYQQSVKDYRQLLVELQAE